MHPLGAGFQPGNHWVECQRCGFDYRKDNIRREWTGLIVCYKCWEPRHEQDFVRGLADDISPPMPHNPPHEKIYAAQNFEAETPAHDVPSATFGNDID